MHWIIAAVHQYLKHMTVMSSQQIQIHMHYERTSCRVALESLFMDQHAERAEYDLDVTLERPAIKVFEVGFEPVG